MSTSLLAAFLPVFRFLLFPLIFWLLGIGLLLLLLMAALAPFESLGWWAGWFGRPAEGEGSVSAPPQPADKPEPAAHYLVYLSGIGAISGDILEPAEIELCEALAARFPGTALINDVFPYAMNNRGLTGQRAFSRMWKWITHLKLEGRGLLSTLINVRNVFQVAVSADARYGPIYNYGTAEVIAQGLVRRGYPLGSGIPVTIIGYSGGAQVALGAATYLQGMLQGVPLYIISLGGVMGNDPGLDRIKHLYHLYGEKDFVQTLGAIAYPGRWPLLPYTAWNRARTQGKITKISLGPVGHIGPKGYFGATLRMRNGQRYLDRSVSIIARVISLHAGDTIIAGMQARHPEHTQ